MYNSIIRYPYFFLRYRVDIQDNSSYYQTIYRYKFYESNVDKANVELFFFSYKG
jgi:hypothetical protein